MMVLLPIAVIIVQIILHMLAEKAEKVLRI